MAPSKSTSYAHYAWAFGHVMVLLGSIYCLYGIATFNYSPKATPRAYKIAYTGALMSWGIVCYKSLGVPQLNLPWVQRALMDENIQYLLLAVYWYFQPPIYITLIPFTTFSLFHTLTFVRTSFLPKIPTPNKDAAAAPVTLSGGQKLSKGLQVWIKNNYERAMMFVSYVEAIPIMGGLILGAITFRSSLLSPIFFAHFLRFRYYLSPQTQKAFLYISTQLDHLLAHPSVPDFVKKGLSMARSGIVRYTESILPIPANAPGTAAAAAGATGAAKSSTKPRTSSAPEAAKKSA